jgi:repressor LexA
MNIGNRIHAARTKKDMTLEELAKMVGVSRQTLSRYETGVIGNIPSDKIELISDALGTTPAYLMGWSPDRKTEEQIAKEDEIILEAYRRASPEIQQAIQRILNNQ